MQESTQAVAPTETPVSKEPQGPAVTDQTPADQKPEAGTQEKPTEDGRKDAWVQRRINELTSAKYRERARAEAAERELERFRQSPQQDADGDQTQQETRPRQDRDARPNDVVREAQRIVDQREFLSRCNTVAEAGEKEFTDFVAARDNLSLMTELFLDNVTPTPAMAAILAAEHPHKVIHHLGTHPDEAEKLLSLPPMSMARAIGALEARMSAKPAPQISKAAEPIKPIQSGSGNADDETPKPNDSLEVWMKKRQKQVHGR